MPWDRTIQFVLEVYSSYGKTLLAGPADSSVRNDLPTLVLGDEMPVEVRFVERLTDGTLALADPGATAEVILSARPAGAPSGSDLLCMATLTRASEAVWTGTLDLNTAEAAAHLIAAPAGAKTILMEAEVRSSGNADRTSLQWDAILRPQVYENQDTPLAMPSPPEWLAGYLADNANAVAATLGLHGYIPSVPGGYIRLMSTKMSGPLSGSLKTSTGYATVMWWDGTTGVLGVGVPSTAITWAKSVPASGGWADGSPKVVWLYSSSTAGSPSGYVTEFECDGESVVNLDVSTCTQLTRLECGNNPGMTYLYVNNCTLLTYLQCVGCDLAALDVSNLRYLATLSAGGNALTSIDLAAAASTLVSLNVASNLLTQLDLAGCSSLVDLSCSSNQLTALNLDDCVALVSFDGDSNVNLAALDFSNCPLVQGIGALGCDLTSLVLDGCADLQMLSAAGNDLTSLDLSDCVALGNLDIADNNLSSIDLSANIALTSVTIGQNPMLSLDLHDHAVLEQLDCSFGQLTSLNVLGCTALSLLNCTANYLTSLDISGGVGGATGVCLQATLNALTSLRALNTRVAGTYYPYSVDISSNQLDGAALDQFYTDLLSAAGYTLVNIYDNPGVATDTPSIATNKGYTIDPA